MKHTIQKVTSSECFRIQYADKLPISGEVCQEGFHETPPKVTYKGVSKYDIQLYWPIFIG